MNAAEFITALVSGGVITYVLGWISGRNIKKAELEGKRLTNLQNTLDIYDRVHTDLKGQLEDLSQKCERLSKQINELRAENITLKREIHVLTQKLKNNE